MEQIKQAVLSRSKLTNEQIIEAFNIIGSAGDVILLKHDGLRSKNKFTVFIAFANQVFESIRSDDETLSDALTKCLIKYFEVKKI